MAQRVHGAKANSYTDGVICAKVARYAERIHHPDRLLHPLRRVGAKGSQRYERISWDEALTRVAKHMKADRDANFIAIFVGLAAGIEPHAPRSAWTRSSAS